MACFVVAEAGINHNGDLGRALEMIDVAASCGADAVKFQTCRPENVVSAAAPKARYQEKTSGAGETQLAMLKRLHLSFEDHLPLKDRARAAGIELMSTPFDLESVGFLVRDLGLKRLKIPSGEVTNALLMHRTAASGLPVILSTGMATLEEIGDALGVIALSYDGADMPPSLTEARAAAADSAVLAALADRVTLLQCTTQYPAPVGDINMAAMDTLAERFGLPVGLSDHSEGTVVSIAAAALGAVVVEKHFTLDRSLPGPDHAASLEPDELKTMIDGIRAVESAHGDGVKGPSPSERENMPIARRSLFAARPIAAGDIFDAETVVAKRPGTGISPMHYTDILGRRAKRSYSTDEPLDAVELDDAAQ
jgi:N-acetylneuraminate synthase